MKNNVDTAFLVALLVIFFTITIIGISMTINYFSSSCSRIWANTPPDICNNIEDIGALGLGLSLWGNISIVLISLYLIRNIKEVKNNG